MELQVTDFENAAFTVFVVLISRVLLALELNLYIPISKLEENMRTAHKVNAVTEGRFWFRKWLLPPEVCTSVRNKQKERRERRERNLRAKEAGRRKGDAGTFSPGLGGGKTTDPAVDAVGGVGGGGSAANGAFAANDEAASSRSRGTQGTSTDSDVDDCGQGLPENHDDQFELMTIREILLGKDCGGASNRQNDCDLAAAVASETAKTKCSEAQRKKEEGSSARAARGQGPLPKTGQCVVGGSNGSTAEETDPQRDLKDTQRESQKRRNGAAEGNNKRRDPDSMNNQEVQGSGPSECHFPGLINLCRTYLDFIGVDSVTLDKLNMYMDFIALRAAGKIQTNAQFIRNFIRTHPSYRKDSRVPADAAYDMVMKAKRIGEGLEPCPEILGPFHVPECRPASNPFAKLAEEGNLEVDT